MKIRMVALAVTLLSVVLLAACGSGGTSAAEHNDADVAFATAMIPHHRQAVQMATTAAGRAGGEPVTRLAAAIEGAQDPEIRQMQGLLDAWGVPGPAGPEHGAAGHGAMAGMMSDQQMQELGQASGPAFDRLWLQMMVAHHEGAVQMARAELAEGRDPDARALAQRIIDAQQAEITQMRGLLG